MKLHTKLYITYFDYIMDDFIPCEMCNQRAVDIHHIEPRGSGGSKTKDFIENLMALCRSCHIKAENSKEFNKLCKIEHLRKLIKKLENEI